MKQIILSCFAILLSSFAFSQTIKGKVVSFETGLPLEGVTVKQKSTDKITVTNKDGDYSIILKSDVPNPVLLFTYVGAEDLELAILDGKAPVAKLKLLQKKQEEVVVIGYGSSRKKDLTGSVISVKGDEMRKVASGNVVEALQGKLPGVDIVRRSGGAGAASSITVRGNRSIIANNSPLFIVDGIQYANIQDINNNDIASIEVLKDASSTAIYGSRGANGVIIITTKKGTSGKPKVSVGISNGTTEAVGYPITMNGPEYFNLMRQAFRTAGLWSSPANDNVVFPNASELALAQGGSNFYWPGALMNKGTQADYNINFSAGSDKTKVFMSYGFFREKGILLHDYSNRHTVRLNVDQVVTDKIKVGLQTQIAVYDQNTRGSYDGVFTQASKIIPIFTPYNADGSLARFPGSRNQANPLLNDVDEAILNDDKINRLLTSGYVEVKPFKNTSIRSNIGLTSSSQRVGEFQSQNTFQRAIATGSFGRITNNFNNELLWEVIANWKKEYGNHSISTTVVSSYLKSLEENSSLSGTGQLLGSQLFYSIQSNNANISASSNYTKSTLLSGAFRVNYGYKGKYLLTLTGRNDGSSILSDNNKWAFFPSVAAAWRISDEKFMENVKAVSDLKLRISNGVAGNSAVRPYSTQSALYLIPFQWNDVQIQAYGLNPQTGNPDLKWELTNTTNIGLDFSLWKNRISGSIDMYDSKTKDLLLLRTVPSTSGIQRIIQNIGKTRNKGIEIGMQGSVINKQNFSWNVGMTFTKNKEQIVELVGTQDDIANRWFIGNPVNSFYDFKKVGIWQTADTALARQYGFRAGDIRVEDINGDKVFTAAGDRKVLGSTVPKFIMGISQDFKYKNFDLNIYLFIRNGQMFVSDFANKYEPNGIENSSRVNYWTPENPTNEYPRPNINISRAAMPFATTLGYQDGSFAKIRNITLGYTLPDNVAKKMHLSKLRFYVNARNFFVFSKIKDFDPEGEGSFERPLTKLLLAGINVEF